MGITPQQFEKLQKRLKEGGEASCKSIENQLLTSHVEHKIILGIDPSLRGTGYGIVRRVNEISGNDITSSRQAELLTAGTVHCPTEWSHSQCFVAIGSKLREVIDKFNPTVCVVEELFFAHNLKTAIVMGEARGAGLFVVAERGISIYEMATRRVKLAIVGYGGAQKIAVAKMVQRMLNLSDLPEPDAADALALAVAYLQETTCVTSNSLKSI